MPANMTDAGMRHDEGVRVRQVIVDALDSCSGRAGSCARRKACECESCRCCTRGSECHSERLNGLSDRVVELSETPPRE